MEKLACRPKGLLGENGPFGSFQFSEPQNLAVLPRGLALYGLLCIDLALYFLKLHRQRKLPYEPLD